MKSPVLTASEDTDVRYIARLFVEQRIGALPIVADGELKGIVTRSDVLSAVMRHFVLQLWA
ncbi:MAG: CBS domain-containing protein [Gammaproteobacteria bacterium]